jgi:signal transduction histidine kinase
MIQAMRPGRWSSLPSARWRGLVGLAIMLAAIGEGARSVEDASRLAAIGALTLIMSVAWLLQYGRTIAAGVWMLGLAACGLMLLLPGNGAIIGVIAAIVNAGMRMPTRPGVVAAVVLGALFVAADGATRHWDALLNTALTASGLAFAFVAASAFRRIREERERADALLVELRRNQDAQLERAALAERARIAREIHDVLAHTLSALAVQLEGARMLLEQRSDDPVLLAAFERAHRLAREGLDETRRAVGALRGDRLPGPDGLAGLVHDFQAETGVPGRLEVQGEPIALASDAQLALYRTAQEALTNVRKHARATSVEVRLRYTSAGAELMVEDVAPRVEPDGKSGGGYGLLGMRERAELIGGTLEAGPRPSGFRVRLWLPKT